MKVAAGTFNGTGAAVYICCGFIPDEVIVRTVADAGTEAPKLEWDRTMRGAMFEGVLMEGDGTAVEEQGAAAGIRIHTGGVMLTSSNQTSVGWGEGVYLYSRPGYKKDWRQSQNDVVNAGEADSDLIDTWTLGHSGNRTGNFNEDIASTAVRIGAGSECIFSNDARTERYYAQIRSLSAGAGETANEVTLSWAVPSGNVEYIGQRYDFEPIPLGEVTPAGFLLSMTSVINTDDEMQAFIARQW